MIYLKSLRSEKFLYYPLRFLYWVKQTFRRLVFRDSGYDGKCYRILTYNVLVR